MGIEVQPATLPGPCPILLDGMRRSDPDTQLFSNFTGEIDNATSIPKAFFYTDTFIIRHCALHHFSFFGLFCDSDYITPYLALSARNQL